MPTRMYMVIDERRDHSFRIPRPDLSVALGTPNACNDCHTKPNETFQWAADAVRKWYGDKRPDDPHWAPAIAAGNRGLPEGETLLAEVIRRPSTPAIVKATAVNLTGQYANPAIVSVQQSALEDGDPLVRAAAVRALSGGASMEQFLAQLGDRLTDPNLTVRLAAARRLAGIPRNEIDPRYLARLDAALDEYRDSQQVVLERAHPHINLGWLERQLGHTQQATDEFRTAIRMEPYLTGPRTELANLLAQQRGDADEIRQLRQQEADLLDRDSELLPDNADVFYRLGLLRYLLGENNAAALALTKACQLSPASYDFRMALALLEERRYELDGDESQFQAAVASLKQLAEMRPNDRRDAQAILQRLLATRHAKDARPQASPAPDAAP